MILLLLLQWFIYFLDATITYLFYFLESFIDMLHVKKQQQLNNKSTTTKLVLVW